MDARRTTQISGMTLAIGLGIAVTTGHGVAAATETTDTTTETSSTAAGTGTVSASTDPEAKATEESLAGTGTTNSDASPPADSVDAAREGATTIVRKGRTISSGGALTSKRIRRAHAKPEIVEPATLSEGVAAVPTDGQSDPDKHIVLNTLPATVKPKLPVDRPMGGGAAHPTRDLVRNWRTLPHPEAAKTDTTARADEPAVSNTEALQPTRLNNITFAVQAPTNSALRAVAPVVAAATTAAAPSPPKLVTGLLRVLGLGAPVALPGAPAAPAAAPLLELAWVAFRRVNSLLFNHTPTARPKVINTDLATGVATGTIGVRDRENDPVTYHVVDEPDHGKVIVNTDGTFTYTPDPDYAHAGGGPDEFGVIVSDKGFHLHLFSWTGHRRFVPVRITVPETNAAPTVDPDNVDTGTGATVTVTTNDTDGDPVTLTHTDPAHGTLVPTGQTGNTYTYTYTPDPTYAHGLSAGGATEPGSDALVFTGDDGHGGVTNASVSFTITPTNAVPAATADKADTGTGATVTMTTDDADGDPVTLTHTDPAHGTLVPTGQTGNTYTYTYTPDPTYAHGLSTGGATEPGSDAVVFTGDDGHGGVTTADVSFTITPINAKPTISSTVDLPNPTDGTTTIVVTVGDEDELDPLQVTPTVTQGVGTLAEISEDNGTITYTYKPDRTHAHQNGPTTDIITFTVTDGHGGLETSSAEVPVPFLNDAPEITATPLTAVRATGDVHGVYTTQDNDHDDVSVTVTVDPDKGSVILDEDTGTWTFTPKATARTAASKVGAGTEARTATITFTAYDGAVTTVKQVTVPVLAPDNVVVATVSGVTNASGVAVGADGTMVYVANFTANRITVIDATTNAIEKTFPGMTGSPEGVVASPDGTKIYVTAGGNGTLRVIDTTTNTIILTNTAVESGPSLLTIVGQRLYITDRAGDEVVVTDTAGTFITRIPVGNAPRGIAVSPGGDFVYVANSGADNNTGVPTSTKISVISTSNNTVVDTFEAGVGPFRVVVSPTGDKLYVTNSGADSVSVLNAQTGALLATVPVGNQPWGIAVTPDGERLYVANHETDNVSVIDTDTNQVIAVIPVGDGPINLTVSPDGTHVYVGNNSGGSVSVISVVPESGSVVNL